MKQAVFRTGGVVAGLILIFSLLVLPVADAQLKKIFRKDFQLENLVVTEVSSVNSHEGVIKAVHKRDATRCFEFSGGQKRSIPCAEPVVSDALVYAINVSSGTELFFANKVNATITDFSVGDKVNVFGNLEENGTTVQASIVRNLSNKGEGSGVVVYNQLDSLLLNTLVAKPDGSHTITATSRMGDQYTITVTNATMLLTKNRQKAEISAFVTGTVFNVWGLFNASDKTMKALVMRTLSDETTGATIQGTIKSINGSSFVLQVKKAVGFPHLVGREIAINSGLVASTSVQVQGTLDPAGNTMSGVRRITFSPLADGE